MTIPRVRFRWYCDLIAKAALDGIARQQGALGCRHRRIGRSTCRAVSRKRRLSRLRLRHLSENAGCRRRQRGEQAGLAPAGRSLAANRTSRRAHLAKTTVAPRHFRNVKERDEDEHYRCNRSNNSRDMTGRLA